MAEPPVIIRRTPSKVIQGTREEIAAQLEALPLAEDERLTLIVPGEEVAPNGAVKPEPTLAEIVAPLQEDLEALGLSDEAHADWIESLVKKARAELDATESGGNG